MFESTNHRTFLSPAEHVASKPKLTIQGDRTSKCVHISRALLPWRHLDQGNVQQFGIHGTPQKHQSPYAIYVDVTVFESNPHHHRDAGAFEVPEKVDS